MDFSMVTPQKVKDRIIIGSAIALQNAPKGSWQNIPKKLIIQFMVVLLTLIKI